MGASPSISMPRNILFPAPEPTYTDIDDDFFTVNGSLASRR